MKPLAEIETPRLRLRHWSDGDFETFAAIHSDPDVMRFYANNRPFTREEALAAFNTILDHWDQFGYGLWVAEDRATGDMIGRIGLTNQVDFPAPTRVEVGWMLARSHWGRGFATEGALAAIRFAFDVVQVPTVISISRPENEASLRVMQRCGLTLRGATHWRGHEVVWYAIDRNEFEGASVP
ncbi:MAG: GNAT family N-acetyltransferase [Actinomycetota bacterium]